MNEITVDGEPLPFVEGQTVAAALVAAGRVAWRTTRTGRRPRGVFCGIGVCFDCLVTIDGVGGQRACLVPSRPGTTVTTATTATTVTTGEGGDG
ncbi:(2Fe-2S)-binding protein [Streptomyces thermolineatus]|uniref:(2Fe-2S)-binding protein n=1 Tax=Streptomyces thermolineatus TaxID=44033 RepID=UPI00384A66E9